MDRDFKTARIRSAMLATASDTTSQLLLRSSPKSLLRVRESCIGLRDFLCGTAGASIWKALAEELPCIGHRTIPYGSARRVMATCLRSMMVTCLRSIGLCGAEANHCVPFLLSMYHQEDYRREAAHALEKLSDCLSQTHVDQIADGLLEISDLLESHNQNEYHLRDQMQSVGPTLAVLAKVGLKARPHVNCIVKLFFADPRNDWAFHGLLPCQALAALGDHLAAEDVRLVVQLLTSDDSSNDRMVRRHLSTHERDDVVTSALLVLSKVGMLCEPYIDIMITSVNRNYLRQDYEDGDRFTHTSAMLAEAFSTLKHVLTPQHVASLAHMLEATTDKGERKHFHVLWHIFAGLGTLAIPHLGQILSVLKVKMASTSANENHLLRLQQENHLLAAHTVLIKLCKHLEEDHVRHLAAICSHSELAKCANAGYALRVMAATGCHKCAPHLKSIIAALHNHTNYHKTTTHRGGITVSKTAIQMLTKLHAYFTPTLVEHLVVAFVASFRSLPEEKVTALAAMSPKEGAATVAAMSSEERAATVASEQISSEQRAAFIAVMSKEERAAISVSNSRRVKDNDTKSALLFMLRTLEDLVAPHLNQLLKCIGLGNKGATEAGALVAVIFGLRDHLTAEHTDMIVKQLSKEAEFEPRNIGVLFILENLDYSLVSPHLSTLVGHLCNKSTAVCHKISDFLASLGPIVLAEEIPRIVELLEHDLKHVRNAAASVITRQGPGFAAPYQCNIMCMLVKDLYAGDPSRLRESSVLNVIRNIMDQTKLTEHVAEEQSNMIDEIKLDDYETGTSSSSYAHDDHDYDHNLCVRYNDHGHGYYDHDY